MINWDELKHIHVIRKLQSVLGQWFGAEVLFLDQEGQVRNLDVSDPKREFKNTLFRFWMKDAKGQEEFKAFAKSVGERCFKAHGPVVVTSGLLESEKVIAARILVDNEYMGSVLGYCFRSGQSSPMTSEQVNRWKEKGFDVVSLQGAWAQLKTVEESDQKYMAEMVELVAQEVVTFHTEISKREERINALNQELGNRYSYGGNMIGKSKAMQTLYAMLEKIKTSESTVLIQGENGTGKELIAKSIHFHSARKSAPFVTVNCSAFNENLLDSELFGHMRGSFTGAIKDKKGLFEAANRGTLFLDEIGDMSPTMQVKLLRVLQEGTLTPVGSTETRRVDVRVLAATNKNLKSMIEAGTFREDLFYRINVINIVVPPLRERREDILVLMDHFLARGCKEKGVPLKKFVNSALEKVLDYPWPGNVRELENEMERVIVLAGDEVKITADLLSARIRDVGVEKAATGSLRMAGKLKDALEELERSMIKEGLRRTNWNKSKLAKELGISRAGLIMKVEKYGLDKRKGMRGEDEAA